MAATDCDVAIAGAGAAGLALALRFARAGRRVLVFDSGPGWRRGDLVSSQLWARRLKWGGAPVASTGRDRIGYNMATGWGTGGAALHHYAGWPRLREADFELRRRYGRGRDWPLRYADLRPHYDAVQAEMGIAGDLAREEGAPPSAPYPLPPLPEFPQAHALRAGFEASGLRLSPAPTAVLTAPWRGRPACLYDGWCDAGCPTGALANPLVVHLDAARQAGARILPETAVTGLTARGGRLQEMIVSGPDGTRRIRAGLFVLAANAVQNARILLAAAPGGLANSSGLLGAAFNCHTLTTAYGLMPEPTENHIGITAGSSISFSEYGKVRANGPFGSFFLGCGSALKPNDLLGIANTRPDLFGEALHRWMREDGPRIAAITVECESDALEDNVITLDARRDARGLPLAAIRYGMSDNTRALWDYARQRAEGVLRAAGAEAVWSTGLVTNHPMGGTRMGRDPADSVCDPWGFTHDLPNLLVAGAGLFPSAGAVGPTFTIYALARRSGDHALAHWRDRVGLA
jgi:choline dehydrogenase-like flavoprotein